MRLATIRWKYGQPPEVKADCCRWLFERGLVACPMFGDLWLVRSAWG